MDYKYIEQLLERYWQCETSLEEEQILCAFFRQEEVPAHLLPYKKLFAYQQAASEVGLGKDFDERILAEIERPVTVARHVSLRSRLLPLYKAAAVVALMLTLGTGVQHFFLHEDTINDNDAYQDTYTDPTAAYGSVSDALMRVSASIQESQMHETDSLKPLPENNVQ